MIKGSSIALAALLLVSAAAGVSAQTTASTNGTVTDESGGVLPGVTVTLRDMDRGTARTEITDVNGRYLARDLPRGRYEVRAELSGFKVAIRQGIELTVGREATVDLVMVVGGLEESVTVTGDAPLIDTSSGTLSAIVTEERIIELPLNSRDVTELVTLEVGVSRVNAGGDRPTGGFAKRITIAGSRPDMTGWLLDGTNIETTYRVGPAGAAGVQLGVDAIQEVRILTNSYPAEYGTVGGGIVSAVTKSGTNAFHGTVFDFLRHDKLDAKNFFDKEKPGFRRDQYGFSVGGPIIPNRTFFFVAFERLKQKLGRTTFNLVPNAAARQGLVPGFAPIVVPNVIKNMLAVIPMPTGADVGGGLAEYNIVQVAPTDDQFWTSRVDHSFSSSHNLYGRFTRSQAVRELDNALGMLRTFTESERRSATVEDTWIMTSRWLNRFRFGYNRASDAEHETENIDLSALKLTAFDHVGVFSAGAGMTGWGGHTSRPVFMEPTNFELANTLSYAAGGHNVKAGAQWRRINFKNDSRYWAGGQWSYASLQTFLAGQLEFVRGNLPMSVYEREFKQDVAGMFVQDSWKVSNKLSLELGLRYEFITVPKEKNGRSAILRDPLDPAVTVGPMFRNPSLKNFAPRLSAAWSPMPTTSVRLGFGVFHDEILMNYYQFASSNTPPFVVRGLLRNVPTDTAYATLTALGPENIRYDLTSFNYDLNTPRMMQYNVNVQQQIGSSSAVQVGYIGSKGTHLLRVREANTALPVIGEDGRKFFPTGLRNRNPAFASDRRSSSDGESWYNGLVAGVTHRMGAGSQMQGSYTWSKSIDHGSSLISAALGGQFGAIDPDDINRNRGLALFDVRHNFAFNAVWMLPWGGNQTGWKGVLFKGWQVGGIVTIQSGIPFTPTLAFNRSRNLASGTRFEVPDVNPDYSGDPVKGGHEQYFDPLAFRLQPAGYIGNLGRNTLIGPGSQTVDASFVKNQKLVGDTSLQFRIEIFNLLNRVNFGMPDSAGVLEPNGLPSPVAGRIRTLSTPARQAQFGIKFVF